MPGVRKSKVWEYISKTVSRAKCRLCQKEVSGKGGNTSNLACHLRRTHKIETLAHPSVAGKYYNKKTINKLLTK